jgi:NTE family protein
MHAVVGRRRERSGGTAPYDAACMPTETQRAPATSASRATGDLALVMSGGGARAAYQVGFLSAIADAAPDFRPQIVTGVSAGAINAAFFGARRGTFGHLCGDLAALWRGLRAEDVMDASATSMSRLAIKWGLRLATGGRYRGRGLRSLIDTAPLRRFLMGALDSKDGSLPGIAEKIEAGELDALALTASSYTSGGTVTFCQGRSVKDWERPNRRSRQVALTVEHVMASSSLPLFFPAIQLDDGWYGDGGIRLTAPLSPAVHLGAQRILAISTRTSNPVFTPAGADAPYPPPSQIGSSLMNAVFLDQFDGDALRLATTNDLINRLPEADRGGLRPIDLQVFRPSQDLGRLANDYEARLPKALRFMTRGTGTLETRSNDFLSMIMFQHDYVARLIEIGETDARAKMPALLRFLTGTP